MNRKTIVKSYTNGFAQTVYLFEDGTAATVDYLQTELTEYDAETANLMFGGTK